MTGCTSENKSLTLQHQKNVFMSTVNALYHIVINTYRRQMTIPANASEEMYRYIWGIIKNHNCVLYRIGGIENHIHMLVHLHPDVSLSSLMRDIKQSSSKWAKKQPLFSGFAGWGKEYAAFSCSYSSKEVIVNYIKNQRTHHNRTTFENEFKEMVEKSGQAWNDYLLT